MNTSQLLSYGLIRQQLSLLCCGCVGHCLIAKDITYYIAPCGITDKLLKTKSFRKNDKCSGLSLTFRSAPLNNFGVPIRMIGKLKSPEITISDIGEFNLLISSDVILSISVNFC